MIGASPPRPKCEISTTAAAKIDATPPSIALPPAAMTRAPASTVNVRPAATTPCDGAHLAADGHGRLLRRTAWPADDRDRDCGHADDVRSANHS